MKILPTLLLMLLPFYVFGVYGCSDDNSGDEQIQKFTLAEVDLQQNFTKEKGELSIPVSTTLDASRWDVASNQDWCIAAKDLSTSKPSIKILVKASEEPEIREAVVTVKSLVKNYEIHVKQLGYGPALLVKSSVSTLEAEGGEVIVTVTSNIEYAVEKSAEGDWLQAVEAPATRALVSKNYPYHAAANPLYEARTVTLTFTAYKDSLLQETLTLTQKKKASESSDVEVEGDVKLTPISAVASELQPGYGIEHTYDGKFDEKHYHSPWGQEAHFPVTLEYEFDGTRDLDYILYHSRSGNGNFGKLKIYTASVEMPEYQLQGNYDFQMQNNASRVVFSQRVKKVTKVKFAVESGAGNFVSCSEMEFFQKNPDNKLEQQLLAVFTDITCSELKPEATLEQINQLPGYFVNLATQLKNGTYDAWEKEFRIQDYQAYSDINVWADRLMTKHYSCLDNLTGIAVEANDEIIVLVGNTHGYPVALQCIGEETTSFGEEKNYVQTAASGDIYFLKEGVNKITIRNRGQLFVMYTADLQSNPTSIRIHIPLGSGQVTGYFDLQRHQTNEKYVELLSKATDKYFGVKGEKMIFYFHRSEMLKHVRTEILSAIHLWDNIVEWEQSLMGIDKMHANQFNNHLFAISPEGAYMWASDYRIAFVYTYLDNILLYDKVMLAEDNAWGPAHEIGHVHQLAIDWMGSTESSNNLFSNYIIYQLGKYKSRGRGLDYLAECVYGQNQAWYNMGSATHQGEDTEIHMRMNWQLWLYYELCKGHDKKPMVWPKIFELMRTTYQHVPTHQPGQRQMAFVKAVCDATQEDLTEFFETWGFFKAVDAPIEQYGQAQYTVTEQMICETKAYIQNKKYPKAAPIQYIEDRKRDFFPSSDPRAQESGDVGYYEVFKNHTKISKVPTYTLSSSHQGATIRVSDGEEAVAFEVRENEANSRLLYFSNSFTFTVPSKVYQSSAKVYAVQADGQRILLTAR